MEDDRAYSISLDLPVHKPFTALRRMCRLRARGGQQAHERRRGRGDRQLLLRKPGTYQPCATLNEKPCYKVPMLFFL